MRAGMVIAVDGPAGAGKSTVARRLARELDCVYVDTGAMYRAVTLKALREGVDLHNSEALARLAERTEIRIGKLPREGGPQPVYVDGADVTAGIRHPDVNSAVSLVAMVQGVRKELVRLQRRLAEPGGIVMDGRDIGTHVLPGADFKFFVTASLEERVRRRMRELERSGHAIPPEELKEQVARRDRLDSTREVAPLTQAPDAILIDTTELSVEDVVETMLRHIRGR